MFEKVLTVVKEFLEKHFFPALISFVIALLLFFITPDNSKLIVKLGKSLYIAGLFCLFILIVEGIYYIYKKTIYKIDYSKIEKENQELEEIKIKRKNFSEIDALSPENRKLLYYFISNNNEPEILNVYTNDSCFFEQYFNSTEVILEKDTSMLNIYTLQHEEVVDSGSYVTYYKLKEYYYDLFRDFMTKYGKISNFDKWKISNQS